MRALIASVVTGLVVALSTAALFLLRVIPRRDEEQRQRAEALAADLRRKIEEAKAARAAAVAQQVAVVTQAGEADKSADSVGVANRIIGGS